MEGGLTMRNLENFLKSHQDSLRSLFNRKRGPSDAPVDSSSGNSPRPIPQLSPFANSVVARCSKILGTPTEELQHCFDLELPESVKQLLTYARNFLEFCSYQALCVRCRRPDYLSDKEFRRLTYDMMLAWEAPSIEMELLHNETTETGKRLEEDEEVSSFFYTSSTNMAVQVDDTKTVEREAFARIAPLCPAIADIITVHNLFDALTSSSGYRLHFLIYDKYLRSLDRILKTAGNMPGPFISNLQLAEGEIILDVDGGIPTQPVLQHIGISAWPGRLTLTNHALYFESLGVGLYDKAVRYDLAMDVQQVLQPELTGPLGARLFDKAVMYNSTSVSDPVYFEFPEFKGKSRRDYWLDISLEILHAHNFVRENNFEGILRLEVLAWATLGVLRYRAVREAFRFFSSNYRTLLAFKLVECLPRGYRILEVFSRHIAHLSATPNQHQLNGSTPANHQLKCSPVTLLTLSRLGFNLQQDSNFGEELVVLDFCAGETNSLEIAVKQSIMEVGRAEAAQATVDKVKVEGIDTNLAVMKELLFPVAELARHLQLLFFWEDRLKSTVFLAISCYVILRGWTQYLLSFTFVSCSAVMFFHKHFHKGEPLEAFTIKAPPGKNAVELLVTLQEGITQLEALIQTSNIFLLKTRALLFAVLPQATERVALFLVFIAAIIAFVPLRYMFLLVFVEGFTRKMPYRKESSERWMRRLREWWIVVPAAPVQLIKIDEKKKK